MITLIYNLADTYFVGMLCLLYTSIVITDGVLRSSASYLHAIGFNADGSAVIGTPNPVSYTHLDVYKRQDSNHRPHDYQSCALAS